MVEGSSQPSLPRSAEVGWQLFSPGEMDQTEKEVSEARPPLSQPPSGEVWQGDRVCVWHRPA